MKEVDKFLRRLIVVVFIFWATIVTFVTYVNYEETILIENHIQRLEDANIALIQVVEGLNRLNGQR